MSEKVLQLSFQGTQLEILQTSFHICGGDGTDGKVKVSWINLQQRSSSVCKLTM